VRTKDGKYGIRVIITRSKERRLNVSSIGVLEKRE
jgi:hypothetical protein